MPQESIKLAEDEGTPVAMMDETQKQVMDSSSSIEERRQFKRKSLKLNKVFSAEVGEGLDVMPLYIFIMDISEGGMRITTHFDLPMTDPFHLHIDLMDFPPLDTDVEVRWKKQMLGGTYMAGLKFLNTSEEAFSIIREFMDKIAGGGKRKSFRLNRVLAVEMKVEEFEEKFYTLTMDLSSTGMRITNPFPLPIDKEINLKMMLDFDSSPLSMKALVRWQKETSYDRFMIGLEFMDINDKDAMRINQYIDQAVSGELDKRMRKEIPAEILEKRYHRYDDDLGRKGDYIG